MIKPFLRAATSVLTCLACGCVMTVPRSAAADVDARIAADAAALVGRMTTAEKIGQLNLVSQGEPIEGQIEAVRAGRIGAMMNVVDPAGISKFQAAATQSRLGVPLLFGLDAVDVFRIAFPPPIAWAATFNPELAERAAKAVGAETAATGINWTFAPMVDISRDPRWGRVVEGGGEDAYLGSVLAAARVRGYLAAGLMPAVKHFVGYGAGEAGRDYNGALIPPSDLYDRYLPPFKAAIDAGARSVMAALNAVNGVPATSNSYLLGTVLRRDLAFTGIVTSDYNAIGELKNHGLTGDLATASRLALKAGIDLDMEGDGYSRHLADELAAGRVAMAELDRAATRVVTLKFKMGLFAPKPRPAAPLEAATRATARQVALESFVLLKNERATLPIATGVRSVAVIGAAAKTDFDESWYGPAMLTQPHSETLVDALTQRLVPGQTLTYAAGFTDRCGKEIGDAAGAVAAAEKSELVVLIVTDDCEFSGEGTSRVNLDLSAAQMTMIDRLAATGKPLVVVVTAGRPLTLTKVVAKADAVLFAWLPRTEGRTAIAQVLTGEVNPSGKLPMTFPRSVGQIPISYNVLPTSRPPGENRYTSRYLDEEVTPLFPFGFGLSYTTFAYSNLRTQKPRAGRTETIVVEVDVRNTGSVAGQEVVQLYSRQPVASRSRPLRELRAFEKVLLRPGEMRTVRFTVTRDQFAFHDDSGTALIEPGVIEFYAGGSSTADLMERFDFQ